MQLRHLSQPVSWALNCLIACVWLGSLTSAYSQPFRVNSVSLDAFGQVHVRHESQTNSYYLLYQGTNVTDISTPVAAALGTTGTNELIAQITSGTRAVFFRIGQVPVASPLDTDHDGIDDV